MFKSKINLKCNTLYGKKNNYLIPILNKKLYSTPTKLNMDSFQSPFASSKYVKINPIPKKEFFNTFRTTLLPASLMLNILFYMHIETFM